MIFLYRCADRSAPIAAHSCQSYPSCVHAALTTEGTQLTRCWGAYSNWFFATFLRLVLCIYKDNITNMAVLPQLTSKQHLTLLAHPSVPTTTTLSCASTAAVNQTGNWSNFKNKLLFWGRWRDSPGCKASCVSQGTWACLHGRAQGLLPCHSVKHPLLLTLTLKFHTKPYFPNYLQSVSILLWKFILMQYQSL